MLSALGGLIGSLLTSLVRRLIGYFAKKKEGEKIEELAEKLITQEKEKIEQATRHELDKKQEEIKRKTDEELDDNWKKQFKNYQ